MEEHWECSLALYPLGPVNAPIPCRGCAAPQLLAGQCLIVSRRLALIHINSVSLNKGFLSLQLKKLGSNSIVKLNLNIMGVSFSNDHIIWHTTQTAFCESVLCEGPMQCARREEVLWQGTNICSQWLLIQWSRRAGGSLSPEGQSLASVTRSATRILPEQLFWPPSLFIISIPPPRGGLS